MGTGWRTVAALVGAAVLATALVGCAGDDGADDGTGTVARPEASTRYTADVPVLVPGSPGEPTTVVSPGESGDVANPSVYSDADVEFVTDMVPHHTQALRMAELAPGRAGDERVLAIAERIVAGQQPEIDTMQAWLTLNGLPPADEESDHTAHQGMPGMSTDEQMLQLVAAEGTEFDRVFLDLMIAHHEGAIQMAEDAIDARNPVITDLVNDVVATQNVEIGRMAEIRADLT